MRSLLPTLLVFLFKLVEDVIRWAVRGDSGPPSAHLGLTPREQVLELERIRRQRNYKPGWLFYRCRELGLEDTLHELREEKRVL
jgi:hypothetical protein